MKRVRWQGLDPRVRQGLLVAGGVEAGLRAAALLDLVPRPASRVRGSKGWWLLALLVVNSVGVVPVAYFLRGRQP